MGLRGGLCAEEPGAGADLGLPDDQSSRRVTINQDECGESPFYCLNASSSWTKSVLGSLDSDSFFCLFLLLHKACRILDACRPGTEAWNSNQ